MRRPVVVLLTLLAAAGSWVFFRDFPVDSLGPHLAGLNKAPIQSSSLSVAGAPVPRMGETIHVASFNLQVFGRTKTSKPRVMDSLAMIIRHFDVIAIQEVRTTDQDVIPRLVDHVNASGRKYDYIVGPRVGRPGTTEQFAYLFDRGTIEADRHQLYTVKDPNDLLHWEPLVGWFRALGPPQREAYTFTLVNVRIDPENVKKELGVLDDVFRAVRDDGRGEDDVILLGDFQQDARQLGPLTLVGGMVRATTGIPTNTQGTEQLDNLVFQGQSTCEFTGRTGVFDFMRRFNFTMDEALEVSDHLPVWAEFSVQEGGHPGRTAQSEGPARQY